MSLLSAQHSDRTYCSRYLCARCICSLRCMQTQLYCHRALQALNLLQLLSLLQLHEVMHKFALFPMDKSCDCIMSCRTLPCSKPDPSPLHCFMQDIVLYNNGIRIDLEKGAGIEQIMEHWDMLQINCAGYINSDLPGLPPNHMAVPMKPTRWKPPHSSLNSVQIVCIPLELPTSKWQALTAPTPNE